MLRYEIEKLLGQETKYSKWYLNIIFSIKSKKRTKIHKDDKDYIYYENHHILPSSIFQDYNRLDENEWNSVLLTGKEHYICHILIWKHYKSLGITKYEMKMGYAVRLMCRYTKYNMGVNIYPSDDTKIKMSKWQKGVPKSKDSVNKMKNSKKGKLVGKDNPNSKIIHIYDNDDKLIYECNGTFRKVCEQYGLPYYILYVSLLENTTAYKNSRPAEITKLTNSGKIIYKGWYARFKK